jgi:hypothetical protein
MKLNPEIPSVKWEGRIRKAKGIKWIEEVEDIKNEIGHG